MNIGITIRNKGPESTRTLLVERTRAAERAGLDDVWVEDHIAIPPDDAEGSGGRYLDPLTTLAYLAGCTSKIGLGTGVLNLPYRAPLPTTKALATLQELSEGRLRLGVGVGWMEAEFRALGVPRNQRGRLTDEALAFIHDCFEGGDETEANGQTFLFLPRPVRPPIFIGGAPPHALERSVSFGDGWMPIGAQPKKLLDPISQLQELASKAGRVAQEVKLMTSLPLGETGRTVDQIHELLEVGVTSVVHGARYEVFSEFEEAAGQLAECRDAFQ